MIEVTYIRSKDMRAVKLLESDSVQALCNFDGGSMKGCLLAEQLPAFVVYLNNQEMTY